MNTIKLIKGSHFSDTRGVVSFNNDFDASTIKRIYFIENTATAIIRAWQGHKIEKRWFSCIVGSFQIKIKKIDDWNNPSINIESEIYNLNATDFEVLSIPEGHISSVQARENNSKLMVMSDYSFGEIKDEYRFEQNHFEI